MRLKVKFLLVDTVTLLTYSRDILFYLGENVSLDFSTNPKNV
jgi:hypothetical protein